jgi:hypothetical protein
MANTNRVFVSPGVYTSEKDLSFVTRQVGVTTLGLVGETVKGPAFQPIFVSNYDEFQAFFGGTNATRIPDNGAPKYELPYVAKSYLSQSNQLYISRILGLSGYDAGYAYGITIDAALDPSTVVQTGTNSYSPLITWSISQSATSITSIVSADPLIQSLYNNGDLDQDLAFLSQLTLGDTGTTASIPVTYEKTGSVFNGVSFNLFVDAIGTGSTADELTGTTTGDTVYYSGTSYSDVENMLVALLRSRGQYDGAETLLLEVTGTSVAFGTSVTGAETDPLGTFQLTGTSYVQGAFDYTLSFDRTKKSYITRVLGSTAQDNNTALYVEELYQDMLDDYITDDKVRGINLNLVDYSREFEDYQTSYAAAETPYLVSEVRGNKVLRLFKFITISDGNTANKEFKISITNIKPDDKEFDIQVRAYGDTDAKPVILERFSRCTMNPTSNNYVARKVGTTDGEYAAKSNYVLIEMDDTADTSDAFPAGFMGFPMRDYQANGKTGTTSPVLLYKETYGEFEKKRKAYLGLSDITGIDQDFFDYKGVDTSGDVWTARTDGFHLDIEASGVTIDGITEPLSFATGNAEFKTDLGIDGTDYEKIYARKFTFAPYGGFDGWDIYRTRRTNTDNFLINGSKGILGLTAGNFSSYALSNGDAGITSDYYAYLEGIWTFRNPESVNINVFATPGIDTFDNTNLVEEAIEMVEQDRADSLYVVTTPDTDSAGDVLDPEEVSEILEDQFDSNYTATYWPWIQINDAENNVLIWVPPTRDVVRNIALTDNIAFPWFAVAGVNRGDVDAIKARKKLTLQDRDDLYAGRINPVATFSSEGIKIWGNKTLQIKESALDRINVRRLLLQARKLVSAVSIRLLFEQNDDIVRQQFLSLVNPILDNIRAERGLTDFRVVLDDDPEAIDRNELCGRIFIKPTRALEFICVEFNILPTGASFDDI